MRLPRRRNSRGGSKAVTEFTSDIQYSDDKNSFSTFGHDIALGADGSDAYFILDQYGAFEIAPMSSRRLLFFGTVKSEAAEAPLPPSIAVLLAGIVVPFGLKFRARKSS